MSTATMRAFPNQPSTRIHHAGADRATAESLFKMVTEVEQSPGSRRLQKESRSRHDLKVVPAENTGAESYDNSGVGTEDGTDVSKTFCEWLTSVRELQHYPADRKKMISSFAMLVFHSGVDDSGEDALLSKEQLDFVGRAPGWNENERKIIGIMKSHFYTIKQLSGQNHSGISYEDISSLFSSRKKLKERLALSASDEGTKTGVGIGIIFQIFIFLISFGFGLNISMLFATVGLIVGFYKEKSINAAITTGIKGALWGMTAGSAMGAVVAANQASRQFDETLAAHVDLLRKDIQQLSFEQV
jgi:hypothetical protein